MSTEDETLDPRAARRLDARDAGSLDLVLEVLFHSDLSRIGERAVLGRADDAAVAAETVVGRHTPLFRAPGGNEQPLADPCLSRRQLSLRFSAALSRIAVDVEAEARRPVLVLDASAKPLGSPPLDVAPGSILALGDRVLLLVALAPRETAPQPSLLGSSPAMTRLRERIRQVAALDGTVLVRGPVGSGKELVARAVHDASRAHDGPFIAVNCAALPEALVESELFGHARGAFSGATTDRTGVFEAARGGTLLLDEIAELTPAAQAKLLRALELRAIRRVGTSVEIPVDVRIIAATSRDIRKEVELGRLRADLYSRLDELVVDVPPLSARRQDVPLLFTTFLRRIADSHEGSGLSRWFGPADDAPPPVPASFFLELIARNFANNVRELEHLAAHVASLNLDGEDFMAPEPSERDVSVRTGAPVPSRPDADRLNAVLAEHGYALGRVARALGVSHSTVDRWMRELHIRRAQDLNEASVGEALAQHRGDTVNAARALRVSERGLALRMRELGFRRDDQ
jgi:DNA-binding NtrC family response regulator